MSAPRPTLVLCSTAPHRRALLARLGLPFEHTAPDFDERGAEHLPPPEMALAYAEGKARSLAAARASTSTLLIGADQVAALEGVVLHKAATAEEAAAQLTRLAGRAHQLHCALVVVASTTGRTERALVTVTLHMRSLSAAQIRRYVEADRPLGSAGGYTFEGLGVALFERIEGGDDSAVVGLPLMALTDLLGRFGVDPLGNG